LNTLLSVIVVGFLAILLVSGLIGPVADSTTGITTQRNFTPSWEGSKRIGFGASGNQCCTSYSGTVPNANKNDLVILQIIVNDTSTTITSISNTAPLVFSLRTHEPGLSNSHVWEYWVIDPNNNDLTFLSPTITFSSTAIAPEISVFAIANDNPLSPFDGTSVLNQANGVSTSITFNPTQDHDLLLFLFANCGGASQIGMQNNTPIPVGFTTIDNGDLYLTTSNCGNTAFRLGASYLPLKQPKSTVASVSAPSTGNWAVIGESLAGQAQFNAVAATPGLSPFILILPAILIIVLIVGLLNLRPSDKGGL